MRDLCCGGEVYVTRFRPQPDCFDAAALAPARDSEMSIQPAEPGLRNGACDSAYVGGDCNPVPSTQTPAAAPPAPQPKPVHRGTPPWHAADILHRRPAPIASSLLDTPELVSGIGCQAADPYAHLHHPGRCEM